MAPVSLTLLLSALGRMVPNFKYFPHDIPRHSKTFQDIPKLRPKCSILFVFVNVSGVWGCGIGLVFISRLHACQCAQQMNTRNNNDPGGENTCALFKMQFTPSKG